jgi:hypothetical protein
MARSTGRAILIGLIWLFSLNYYLEVRRLPEPSERMTISAVFWVLTLFTVLEGLSLWRNRTKRIGKRTNISASTRSIVRDRRAQLGALTLIYLGLIPIFGFFSASFLAFGGFSYALGTRGVWKILLPGFFVLISIYVIFVMVLKLALPSGLFF